MLERIQKMQKRQMRKLLLMGLVVATPVVAQDYPRAIDPQDRPRLQQNDERRAYEDQQRQIDLDAQRKLDAQRHDAEQRDREANRNERRFEARVTSVRAVVNEGEQRCWVERQRVVEERRDVNVPGAVVGAILGGVLGHQVGSGRGRDVATVGGAAAGGLLGANVGNGGSGDRVVERDVQKCRQARHDAHPEFYDVTYTFRGQAHRAQLAYAPGQTLAVNRDGVPI